MKLISFQHEGRKSCGIVGDDERILDLGADPRLAQPDLGDLLAAGPLDGLGGLGVESGLTVRDIAFLPVIPNPAKILCVGLNYESHRLETGRAKEQFPVIFTRFADSQIGHGQPLIRPIGVSAAFDYEGEVAVVIGRPGYRIGEEQAASHVAGYACYNDATLRDWQRHTHQFTPGKTFPGTGAFGPYLVTPDEAGAIDSLRLTTRLNGAIVQSASTAEFLFSLPRLIAYCSAFTPLSPGDVILTGTPGGVGFKREPQLFLQPGDIVEVEVDRLGTLRNPVIDETPSTMEAAHVVR